MPVNTSWNDEIQAIIDDGGTPAEISTRAQELITEAAFELSSPLDLPTMVDAAGLSATAAGANTGVITTRWQAFRTRIEGDAPPTGADIRYCVQTIDARLDADQFDSAMEGMFLLYTVCRSQVGL